MDLMEKFEERPLPRKKVSKKVFMAGERFKKEPLTPPTVVGKFICLYKREKCQALKYSDGSVKVGVDVFRLLDKHDFPSFDVREFRTFADFMYHCEILPDRQETVWYVKNTETEV